MPEPDRVRLAEGLAVKAVALVEMGADEPSARAELLHDIERIGILDVDFVREASSAIARLPQPLDETPDEIVRAQPVRELFGLPSAEEDLVATLVAREWLDRLADDLEQAMREVDP